MRLLAQNPNLYSPREVDELVSKWTKIAAAGQAKSAANTEAYLAKVLSELEGHPVAPKGIPVDPTALRNGTTPDEVYNRVAEQYRYAASAGKEPMKAAQQRLKLVISDDLHLAEREAQHQTMQQPRIKGYRRIIHPELSRGGVCGLCLAASDRVYSKEDLLPIHGNCRCTVLPIVGRNDPGKDVDQETFKQLYKLAGGSDAASLARIRYEVHEHGELGPVLRKAGDEFRGPSEIPDAA